MPVPTEKKYPVLPIRLTAQETSKGKTTKDIKSRQSTSFTPAAARALPHWWVSFNNWMVNVGKHRIFFGLFFLGQAISFLYWYCYFQASAQYSTFRSVLGMSLFIARGAARTIDLLCAIILFTVCRNLISLVRGTFLNRIIPLDKNITLHIYCGWSIVFWSIVHCAGQFFNFLKVNHAFPAVDPIMLNTQTGVSITGHILVVVLFLITTSAIETVRRSNFEMFWFTHHLFLVFFGASLLHGSFCFIKVDSTDVCGGGPKFWKYWIASGVFYFLERLYRVVRGRATTYICKVVEHPSNVIEIQMRKPSFKCKAGQYIFICCPEISPFEWHPFTLTNSPYEDFVTIHMRIAGDWTAKMAKRLGCGSDNRDRMFETLPYVMIDGPYGSASEDAFDYEAAVLIGAGIGVTPFASILKTIWYRMKQCDPNQERLRSLYFLWLCRDKQAFEWFQELLATLEEEDKRGFLHIHAYLTQKFAIKDLKHIMIHQASSETDVITRLKSKTHYGRPDWDMIFSTLQKSHKGKDVGVFFCGPKSLSNVLHGMCNKYTESTRSGTRFYYSKGNQPSCFDSVDSES